MKCLAKILVVVLILCLVGGFIFGRDLIGYLRSSAGSVRDAVKNSVPTEFELRRARDLLEEIIPEMHANIRLIAQEEVEIAALKADIERSEESLNNERGRIEQISAMLGQTHLTGYSPRNHRSDKSQLKEDLARRFDGFKQAEIVLAGKHRLLEAREKSYQAALGLLERTRSQKMLLAQKIEALDSQNRLIQTLR